MSSEMESSTNRFADPEDEPIDGTDVTQLMANCEKWSLKNDLELLSHLKQLSNHFVTKTEATNQSINSLVFEAKMNGVKVDNVINELQMLANSQFVENRVYDEEMDDIMANETNGRQSVEMVATKSKEEDILPKIKSALNIGLEFLGQRFDCVSKQVPQNDSDDENDQIVEGLISDTTRDEYSQRLLPYIIGSEDFINDNNVGLSRVDETANTHLKIEPENDSLSVDSDVEAFDFRNAIPDKNIFNDHLSDSDDDSKDIFGSVPSVPTIPPKNVTNNEKDASSDESDFDTFTTEEHNEDMKAIKEETKQRVVPSFQDELSAAISAKNPFKESKHTNDDNPVTEPQIKTDLFANEKPIQTPISLESESSDESDSIFKVNKSKPKIQTKQKSNFDGLFGNQTKDNSLFGQKPDKPLITNKIKVLPNIGTERVATNNSSLFDDEDDDDGDDLFSAVVHKKPNIESVVNKKDTNSGIFDKKKVPISKKPVIEKRSLFSDDDNEEDIDDLFITAADSTESVSEDNEKTNVFNKRIEKSIVEKKSLFSDDDDEDGDDLFIGAINKKIVSSTSTHNNMFGNEKQNVDRKPLFDDEDIDDLFISANEKKLITKNIVKESESSDIFPKSNSELTNERPIVDQKSLFSDDSDSEDNDDLFSAINKKTNIKPIVEKEIISDIFDKSVTRNEKPVVAQRTQISLLGHERNDSEDNDEEEVDDLFKSVANKSNIEFSHKKNENSNVLDIDSVKTRTNASIINKKSIFSDEDNDDEDVDDLFSGAIDKQNIEPIINDSKSSVHKNKVIKTVKPIVDKKPSVMKKPLFSDEDTDDLFIAAKHKPISEPTVTAEKLSQNNVQKSDKSVAKTSLFDDEDDDDLFTSARNKKPIVNNTDKKSEINAFDDNSVKKNAKKVVQKTSLFDDEDSDDEDDDLFSTPTNKKATIRPVVNQESKSAVQPTNSKTFDNSNILDNILKKEKPIVDLKSVFDEEDDDDDDLFTSVSTKKKTIEPNVNKEETSAPILANDGLKHRALLGSKLNRRPPSKAKKHLKQPID